MTTAAAMSIVDIQRQHEHRRLGSWSRYRRTVAKFPSRPEADFSAARDALQDELRGINRSERAAIAREMGDE